MSTETPAELANDELTPAEVCRRATYQMVNRAASDMAGLSDALLDRVGGVGGWAQRYIELMDLCRKHGNARVEADLLKMIPDTMERAQIRANPGLAVAFAKDAGFVEVPVGEEGGDG